MRIVVTAVGRCGKDPELRSTPQGRSVVQFSIGCWAGKSQDGKSITQWFDCSIWGNDDEQRRAMSDLGKGKAVTVIGSLTLREYQGKQYHSLTVNEWQVHQRDTTAPTQSQSFGGPVLNDDDVPF